MGHFKDKVAIVTGGASGIGRALCEALVQNGAVVIVADINAERAEQVTSAITAMVGRAHAAHLDVSRGGDVQRLVKDTASEHGRLDYIFNNAGIGMGGEMRDTNLEHWQRILDINLWGVIYGTMAAYQVMLKQGFGHIVNTASAAGLVPSPMQVPYAATKHAVVGLSASLRAEAAELGVMVSVVCPGFVRTEIFETSSKVTKHKHKDAEADFLSGFKMMGPADCAQAILRGVARNKAIIPVTGLARLLWWSYRLHPALLARMHRTMVRDFQALRGEA